MKPERIWVVHLLRKDNQDELDSVMVLAVDKWDAGAKGVHEFKERHGQFHHHAYIWVEEKTK